MVDEKRNDELKEEVSNVHVDTPAIESNHSIPDDEPPSENAPEREGDNGELNPSEEKVTEPQEKSRAELNQSEEKVTEPQEAPQDELKAPVQEGDNYSFLNSQIDKLISVKEEKNFTDFWFYVKELNKLIFVLKGISKEDRLKFKDRINELCEDAKKLQDELKARVAKTSGIKLDKIRQMLDEALSFGASHEELEKSFKKIEEASRFFKDGKVQSEDGEESADLSREHRDEAKELIRKAKDQIFDRKRGIREANFKQVIERLTAISEQLMSDTRPQKVFDAVKKLREEMRRMILDRPQLREIDEVIETIWKKAKEKLNSGREDDTKKRMQGLEQLIRKKQQFIQILEKEIKDLNLKWADVKNDFFKNRVNEWMEEKKEKIEITKKEIESTKEKVTFLAEQIKRNSA